MIRRLYIFYIRDIASSTTKNMMGDSELSLMVKDVDQESSAEAKSDRKMFASSQTFGSFHQNTLKKNCSSLCPWSRIFDICGFIRY